MQSHQYQHNTNDNSNRYHLAHERCMMFLDLRFHKRVQSAVNLGHCCSYGTCGSHCPSVLNLRKSHSLASGPPPAAINSATTFRPNRRRGLRVRCGGRRHVASVARSGAVVSEKFSDIRRLSENSKIGAMDHAEIVGDSVAETAPVSGHGIPQERDDLCAELWEGLVVPIVGDVFMHQGPQPLDRIEMGTVLWKETQQAFAPGRREPLFDDAGFVILGVVDEDVDEAFVRMGAFDLSQ